MCVSESVIEIKFMCQSERESVTEIMCVCK